MITQKLQVDNRTASRFRSITNSRELREENVMSLIAKHMHASSPVVGLHHLRCILVVLSA